MKAFLEIIKLELKEDIQYPLGFTISIIIQPVILLINISLYSSIYRFNNTALIKGYSLGQMVWYFTSMYIILSIVFNFTDSRISRRILSGELSMDLLRPISLFRYELGISLGLRITAFIVEVIPGIIVYTLIYFPSFMTPISILRFICVVVMAFMIMYMINFLTGLSAFILKSNSSITSIKYFVIYMLGGSFIPLDFFPPTVNRILRFLPFEYIFYWPAQFLLNTKLSWGTSTLIQIIAIQALWIALLYCLCRVCWNCAIKHFCAVG